MTSRERIVAAVKRQPVDYVPCCISFNPLTPAQRRGYEWQFPWPPEASREERLRYQVEELGLDQVVTLSVDACAPEPFEPEIRVEDGVLHKSYDTPAGVLHAAVSYDEKWPHGENIPFFSDFNIGHFIEPWIETERDFEAFKLVRALADDATIEERAATAVAEAQATAARWDLATLAACGMGLTGAQHLFGATQLCMMTLENPDLVHAYLEYDHTLNMRALKALGGRGVDMVRRNGFYETADFYGPTMLQEFLGERLRAERKAAHAGGMLMTYTVNTGVMPILDYLRELAIDSLFGIDLAFSGVDPRRLHDALGEVSSFWTGPSSVYHIWKGPQPTREAVRQTFEVFGRTGLILAPCVSSHSIMPWESTVALIDEWKRLR